MVHDLFTACVDCIGRASRQGLADVSYSNVCEALWLSGWGIKTLNQPGFNSCVAMLSLYCSSALIYMNE